MYPEMKDIDFFSPAVSESLGAVASSSITRHAPNSLEHIPILSNLCIVSHDERIGGTLLALRIVLK